MSEYNYVIYRSKNKEERLNDRISKKISSVVAVSKFNDTIIGHASSNTSSLLHPQKYFIIK